MEIQTPPSKQLLYKYRNFLKYLAFFVILIVLLIFWISTIVEPTVHTREFETFEREMQEEGIIKEMKVLFREPSITINVIVPENFTNDDFWKLTEEIRPVINKKHMAEVAKKYWSDNKIISYVHLNVYLEEMNETYLLDNLLYSVYTRYYRTSVDKDKFRNRDEYESWYIHYGEEDIPLRQYLAEYMEPHL